MRDDPLYRRWLDTPDNSPPALAPADSRCHLCGQVATLARPALLDWYVCSTCVDLTHELDASMHINAAIEVCRLHGLALDQLEGGVR